MAHLVSLLCRLFRRRHALAIAAGFLLLGGSASPASASHFRGGDMGAQYVSGAPAGQQRVQITLNSLWRKNASNDSVTISVTKNGSGYATLRHYPFNAGLNIGLVSNTVDASPSTHDFCRPRRSSTRT